MKVEIRAAYGLSLENSAAVYYFLVRGDELLLAIVIGGYQKKLLTNAYFNGFFVPRFLNVDRRKRCVFGHLIKIPRPEHKTAHKCFLKLDVSIAAVAKRYGKKFIGGRRLQKLIDHQD